MARELDAVHVGHVNVGEYQVRRHGAKQGERFPAACRFPYDDQRHRIGAVVEHFAQSMPRRRLVVDDEDL